MPAYNDTNFRALFKAFADEDKWPEVTLSLYWTVATDYISPKDSACNILNGASLQLAIDLVCAHLATLFNADADNVADGEDPGQPVGIGVSATIGSVSVSQLPPPIMNDPWKYWLNQTSYGAQLLALLSVKSVGGFYVGGLPERNGFRKFGGTFG
jgi:hypothetical protein